MEAVASRRGCNEVRGQRCHPADDAPPLGTGGLAESTARAAVHKRSERRPRKKPVAGARQVITQ